jgi:DNA repair protein RecO (recombination protein O)
MLYKVDAIVLRSRDLGEADKALTLFSREEGKIQAAARGARRPRNRMAGAAQALTHGRFMLFGGGRGMDSINQCEIKDSFQGLREDLVKGTSGQYAAELLDLLTRDRDRNEGAFILLLTCLCLLGEVEDTELVLRLYELRLLAQIGYRPRLDRCAGCEADVATLNPVLFCAPAGGLLCAQCREQGTDAGGGAGAGGRLISRGTVETMRRMLDGDLRRALNLRPLRTTREEMVAVIHGYILWHFEKLPRSLEFLTSLL